MPIIGISITKETTFRESVQPFSNVYYYNNGAGSVPDSAGGLALIDQVTNFEKSIHGSSVTFTYGRIWHQTLTELLTIMIEQKPLSGTGSITPDSQMDKERAHLIRWRAGADSRGNPVYLRKWYHTCSKFGAAPGYASGVFQNVDAIPQATRDQIGTIAQAIATLSAAGGGWDLCSKNGRSREGSQASSHRYLEHHQLGDKWRGD